VESVKSLTGNSHVHGFAGDFSDFADIRRFASDVSQVHADKPAVHCACRSALRSYE